MRFGMSGAFLPSRVEDFTPQMAARVREFGFSGIFTRFTDSDPSDLSDASCQRFRSILAEHGLRLYQCLMARPVLIHPDQATRQEAVRVLQRVVRAAARLGARGVHCGPGSLSLTGAWFPHPYNRTAEAKSNLIASLREVAPVAEGEGIYLGMEGHQLVTLDGPETMRDVLDAVGSPRVKTDLDPVNWITLSTIFGTGDALRHMLRTVGHHVIGGHAKDVRIEDRLVVHINECAAGTGLLDYPTFLQEVEAVGTDLPLVVEHCATEELPQVSQFLHQTAREVGIPVHDG